MSKPRVCEVCQSYRGMDIQGISDISDWHYKPRRAPDCLITALFVKIALRTPWVMPDLKSSLHGMILAPFLSVSCFVPTSAQSPGPRAFLSVLGQQLSDIHGALGVAQAGPCNRLFSSHSSCLQCLIHWVAL